MNTDQVKTQIEIVQKKPWWQYVVYAGIALCVAALAAFIWNRFKPADELASHDPVIAKEAKKAVNINKATIAAPKTLEVYDRSDLLKKVPVPVEVSSNEANQFTSTANIPPMPYGGQAVGFTNTTDGTSGISIEANKRPLFGFGGKTGIGAIAGVSTRGNIAGVYANQDIARIGGVNVGVAAGGGTIGNDGVLGGMIHVHSEF